MNNYNIDFDLPPLEAKEIKQSAQKRSERKKIQENIVELEHRIKIDKEMPHETLSTLVSLLEKNKNKVLSLKTAWNNLNYDLVSKYVRELIRSSEDIVQMARSLPVNIGEREKFRFLKECIGNKYVSLELIDENVLHVVLDGLAPKRTNDNKIFESLDYIHSCLYAGFDDYFSDKEDFRYNERVIILYTDYYKKNKQMKDYDNLHHKIITDYITMYTLEDDDPHHCIQIHNYGYSSKTHTEALVIPVSKWDKYIPRIFSS